jgi:hypothetical protein
MTVCANTWCVLAMYDRHGLPLRHKVTDRPCLQKHHHATTFPQCRTQQSGLRRNVFEVARRH